MKDKSKTTYEDFALVLAWPDQTARGDEPWMALLKRVGIVKNLNFRVGHAAIILVQRSSGSLFYYDFGRYITPRGYGRARSAASDPRLALSCRAEFDGYGRINNLDTILAELHKKEYATHGGGRLFFSVADRLCYAAAARFALRMVEGGPVKYGALARGNNSCSRFVAQILLNGLQAGHSARKWIGFPETIKPSPMSNVVNASPDKIVYCYHKGKLQRFQMGRRQSLKFQLSLLRDNLSTAKAKRLPCDRKPGNMKEPKRPSSVPPEAHWLGGIGEGAWYAVEGSPGPESLMVVKYGMDGNEEYRTSCSASQPVNPAQPYRFTYHCHYQRHIIVQKNQQIVLLSMPQRTQKQVRTA